MNDYDFFFYFHEDEEYISVKIGENKQGIRLSKNEGRMITNILQEITNRLDKF